MGELKIGQIIHTRGLKPVKVIEELGRGGQGVVYKVDYAGKPMALKWFADCVWNKPERVYENLKNNIDRGSPMKDAVEDTFLWPRDITEWDQGSFGYIMDLRPDGFLEFSSVLVSRDGAGFTSFRLIVGPSARSAVQVHNAR